MSGHGRATRGAPPGVKPDAPDQYDLALLCGGPRRACFVALVALSHAGLIDCGESLVHELVRSRSLTLEGIRNVKPDVKDVMFVVRPLKASGGGLHPVEKALLSMVIETPAVAGNVVALRGAFADSAEIQPLRDRLVQLRLVRSEIQRAVASRRLGVIVAAFLTLELVAASLLTVTQWWLFSAASVCVLGLGAVAFVPKLTLRGWWVVKRAKLLQPRPWTPTGEPLRPPSDLCLLLALYGELTLWDVDPALALALGLVHLSDLANSCAC